jgi:hypothetical protein
MKPGRTVTPSVGRGRPERPAPFLMAKTPIAKSLLSVGGFNHRPQMSCFPVFYCSPVGVGAGFKPVEARDAYEAEQIVQREYPGAVTASLSERVTNEEEIKRLFMDWLEKV